MIHAPSLAIGAGIAAGTMIAAFFVFGMFNEPELAIQPTPAIQKNGPPKITLTTFVENGSPILGNPNAPVTLVEFGDYQCFFCNKFFHTTEDKLFKEYVETGKVKVIFKDFQTIVGSDSINAARAAHCANDQDSFWKYHDTLYNNWDGENTGWASSENLLRYATDSGLDVEQFSKCMAESKYAQIVEDSNQDAKDLGLTGTPAFFVITKDNKVTKIDGAQPYEVFARIFDSASEK